MKRSVGLIGLLALVVATAAAADYSDSYIRGMQAMDGGEWDDVVHHMRQAIAEQPQAGGARIRLYGTRYEEYIPYYYLGLALRETGDQQGALQAWEDSAAQGVAAESKRRAAELTSGLAELRQAVAPSPTPNQPQLISGLPPQEFARYLAAAAQAIALAEAAQAELEEAVARPQLAPVLAGNSALGSQRQLAEQRLAAARRQLAAGRAQGELSAVLKAQNSATQAASDLEKLGQTLLVEEQKGRARKEPEPETMVASAPDPLPAPAIATPAPTTAAATGPPTELLFAANAYFKGEYAEAERLLSAFEPVAARTVAHASLLRAAARFARFRLEGQSDLALLEQARQDIRSCRKAQPTIIPAAGYFSPSFIKLFANVE